jgi:hypothetical protein
MKSLVPFVGLVFCLVANRAHGQNIQLGAKAGFAVSNFVGDKDTDFDAKFNFSGGFPFAYRVNRNVEFTPEILYVVKGAETVATIDNALADLSFSVVYLEFPLVAKYILSPRKKFTPIFTAGPVVSWNIDARVRYSAVGSDVEFNEPDDSIRSLDVGVAVGAGVDFSWDLRRITVEIRYTRGVSNLVDTEDDPKYNGVLALTAGVGL